MSTTGSASDDETSESDIEECSAEVLSVLQGSVRVFCSGKMLHRWALALADFWWDLELVCVEKLFGCQYLI